MGSNPQPVQEPSPEQRAKQQMFQQMGQAIMGRNNFRRQLVMSAIAAGAPFESVEQRAHLVSNACSLIADLEAVENVDAQDFVKKMKEEMDKPTEKPAEVPAELHAELKADACETPAVPHVVGGGACEGGKACPPIYEGRSADELRDPPAPSTETPAPEAPTAA